MSHRSRRRTWRSFTTSAAALAASGILAASAVAAAPAPSSGSATVDGDPAEWNTTADFFSDMIRAGGNGGQTKVESKLYLRHDCTTGTLYAYVSAEPGVTIAATLPDDSFIKIGGTKRVDGNATSSGPLPNFAWVGLSSGKAFGWEAAIALGAGSYTMNVHSQVNDGGLQTSAVPSRSIPLVISCDETVQPQPLMVTKTADTSFTRVYDWTLVKQATQTKITTAADQATFTYNVTATKSGQNDSNFMVTGDITVTNPNATAISGVTIADQIQGGPTCTVQGGIGATIPGNGFLTVPYTCSVIADSPATNVATATWTGGVSAGEVSFAFGKPTTTFNDSVDVTDAFNGDAPALLAGGSHVNATTTLTYTRTVPVPATGCTSFDNVATLTSPSPHELRLNAGAQVQACRTPLVPPVTPLPPATTVTVAGGAAPAAVLRVVKRGPANAAAGQVVTFTITVRNTSATTIATSVVLSDVLPVGYAIAKRPSGAVLQKGKLMWSVGDLAPGAFKTVRVQVRIDRNAGGTRCNTANASAANATTVQAKACTKVRRIAGATRIPIVTG